LVRRKQKQKKRQNKETNKRSNKTKELQNKRPPKQKIKETETGGGIETNA